MLPIYSLDDKNSNGTVYVRGEKKMKINHLRNVNVNPYNKQVEKLEQTQKAKSKDKIEISSEAIKLQKIGNIELERQEKVDALKREVQSGQYELNAKKVAEKMYSYWDDLK